MKNFEKMMNGFEQSVEVWWPSKKKFEPLFRSHRQAIEAAYKNASNLVGGFVKRLDELAGPMSHALSQRYLSQFKSWKTHYDPEKKIFVTWECFVEEALTGESQGHCEDLLISSAYAAQDERAAQYLVNLVDGGDQSIRNILSRRYQQGFGALAADNLISHVSYPTTKGFNRGQSRINGYSGQASLKNWLLLVGSNLAKSMRTHEYKPQPVNDDLEDGINIEPENLAIVSELNQAAYEELLGNIDQLKSPQLYQYALLRIVFRYEYNEIALKLFV